jgi:hypothetical protein
MNFIERVFGISPDGGTGALELVLMAAPVLIVASLAAHRRWLRRSFRRVDPIATATAPPSAR